MKKRIINLLTPIAAITAITPLCTLTSCSSEEEIEMVDITKGFTPTFDKRTEPLGSAEDATKAYIDWLNNNENLCRDDITYGTYLNWKQSLPAKIKDSKQAYYAEIKKLEFGAAKPNFGRTFVQYPGREKQEYPTLSTKIKFHAEFTFYFLKKDSNGDSSSYTIDYVFDVTSELDNMLFFVKQHGLNNISDTRVKPVDATVSYNAWNVTTFDRGTNAAYIYRNDNWGMKSQSTCHRKITHEVNSEKDYVREKTNSFSANINNPWLVNQVQDVVVQGNKLFDEVINTDRDNPYWDIDGFVDTLTGDRSGAPKDQLDSLLFTASAGTIDYASYYLSDIHASYAFNTFQPLTCSPILDPAAQGMLGPKFYFYTLDDETGAQVNSGFNPWYLERSTTDEEHTVKEIEQIKLKDPNGIPGKEIDKIVDKLTITIKAPNHDGIIYQKPSDPEELEPVLVPLQFVGELKDAEGNDYQYPPKVYQDDFTKCDTFKLNVNEIPITITFVGGGTEETTIPLDYTTVQINFDAVK